MNSRPGTAIATKQEGFTLLEVIVSLTITGFILGGLFTLVAGSKQLSWRSQESLVRAVNARAQINFALLENEFSEVELILDNERFQTRPGDLLEEPERKTQGMEYTLQAFEIVDDARDEVFIGSRWLRLELPK